MTQDPGTDPLLARVVRDARSQSGDDDAVPVAPGIHQSTGISNSYLVHTSAGSVVINAGTDREAVEVHGPRYRGLDPDPPLAIITTQGHRDHVGGVPVLAGPRTTWIAHRASVDNRRDMRMLRSCIHRRTNTLWGFDAATDRGDKGGPDDRDPDQLVDDRLELQFGDTRIELLSTPGGETTGSIVVWLPDRDMVFTGNLFGPFFGHLPNLYTLRGDRIRSAMAFVASLERVRALGPSLLVTGHLNPIAGQDRIQEELVRIRDAIQYIHDATVDGMNAGVDLMTLMRTVALPDHLSLPQSHGKVPWCVRAIWEEYLGWFRMETTTELYAVPMSNVYADLVEAAGTDALASRARTHLRNGRPLEALHLTDVVLHTGDHLDALQVRLDSLDHLHTDAGGENFSETMWLRAEMGRTRHALERATEQAQT